MSREILTIQAKGDKEAATFNELPFPLWNEDGMPVKQTFLFDSLMSFKYDASQKISFDTRLRELKPNEDTPAPVKISATLPTVEEIFLKYLGIVIIFFRCSYMAKQ